MFKKGFYRASGFLIGTILLNKSMERKFSMRELMKFWLRRWFRTLPAYYLMLGIIILCSALGNTPLPSKIELYGIFSQNIITVHPAFFPEAWSLSVEEWFYLLVPFMVFICIVRLEAVSIRKAFLALLIFGIVAVTVARIEIAMTHDLSDIGTWDLLLRKESSRASIPLDSAF
jgi:peptidoglycan/LPS O-acetylase OafA/YrhL